MTAARALGIGRSAAYEPVRAGHFPCPVLRLGSRYRVTRADLFEVLSVRIDNSSAPETEPGNLQPSKPTVSAVLPEGGTPVVLVIQAVILPGDGLDASRIRFQAADS